MVIVTKSKDKVEKATSLPKIEDLSARSEDGMKGLMFIGKGGKVVKARQIKVMKTISSPEDYKSESSTDFELIQRQQYDSLNTSKVEVMQSRTSISAPNDDESEMIQRRQYDSIKTSKGEVMQSRTSISAPNDDGSEISDDEDTIEPYNNDFSDKMDRCFVIEEISGMAKRLLKGGGMKDVFNLIATHPNGQRRVMSVWGPNGYSAYTWFM
jgi:hypothetical protein